MGLISCQGAKLLSELFAAIEGGAKAPGVLTLARTAFLSKGEDDLCPIGYRGLAILSKVYRLYACIRLRHLAPWINGWEREDLFAGITAACGAEDAWFLAALRIELAKLKGEPVTGGSTDIYKFFDEIVRQLL